MSKINIQGTVDNIRSKSNVYTPIIEAIVNAIDSIRTKNLNNGQIEVVVKREQRLQFDNSLPEIRGIEIHDNGKGFTEDNRESFDTLYSLSKKNLGGKGFGRFMYLKYFSDVKVESNYKAEDGNYRKRNFTFGKKDEIIVNETNITSTSKKNLTILFLNDLHKDKAFDKELDTIARKLVEKLLIFFINENFTCPQIVLREFDNSKQIVLNNYLSTDNEIKLVHAAKFKLQDKETGQQQTFQAKIFKIYFSRTDSKIILTGHNREVTETTLHTYVPEFEDEFFDEFMTGKLSSKKNYVIKAYVIGQYLDDHVSLERESFDFPKKQPDILHAFAQASIEKETANRVKAAFEQEVKLRSEKKRVHINDYVNQNAPWHKQYIGKVDFSSLSYTASDEDIELYLQKYKFDSELASKRELRFLLHASDKADFEQRLGSVLGKITDNGKSDLVHYVCNRRVVLEVFEELRKRNENGSANLEKEIHSLIYPMNTDSSSIAYEDHNLWLLDDRLVFAEYIASDRKISKKKDALDEPDLLVFDKRTSFRNGDNEYSNPLSIFEFKRPKRKEYGPDDDPILQIGKYLDKIRQGKYEMPQGIEPIKVNNNTPVYAYVVCDLVDKIHDFARNNQLTVSPDNEGYFGYHSGYKMYIEIVSYKKLLKDATMRNKIFFKKLQID